MIQLELYLILLFGGALFVLNGVRKRHRKDVFLHGSLAGMVMPLISLITLMYYVERIMEYEIRFIDILFIIIAVLAFISAVLYKIRYEMNHKKMNIHNLTTDEVELILMEQLDKYRVDYQREDSAGKRRIFTFPDRKGEIALESHYISEAHQRVTFSKTNHIPMFEDVFEGVRTESGKRERNISKTLGVLDFLFGGGLMIMGIYMMQLIS